jgi:acetoin utilization deacetylase AcuC-like enzyme
MSRRIAVYSRQYRCDIGPHVFPVVKFGLTLDGLLASGDVSAADVLEPPEPIDDDLLLGHDADYLSDLRDLRWTPRTMYSELPLTAGIVRAYMLAASGTTLAAREAMAGHAVVHLGGGFHHAFRDRAEGFCYINDLAVAVKALQRDGVVRRAAIVDLDVHQGNGTARIFAGDPSVFTLSVHQERNYPAFKERSDLDVGLDDLTADEDYLARLEPALARVWEFGPDLLLYQAGADPYLDDQLGGLRLTFEGLERRDRLVLETAAERSIPTVVTLGGGYARNLDDTVRIHLGTCRMALRLGDAARNRL